MWIKEAILSLTSYAGHVTLCVSEMAEDIPHDVKCNAVC